MYSAISPRKLFALVQRKTLELDDAENDILLMQFGDVQCLTISMMNFSG